LFAIARHKIIPVVQVTECGIAGDPAFGADALVVQEPVPAFVDIEQEMQFAAGVNHFVGDMVLRFVVELAFEDDAAPLEVAAPVERQDHDILGVEAGGVVAVVPGPGVIVGAIIIR
jgi:hypothetical protein